MPKCFSRYSVSLFISQTASDLLWFALPDGFPLPWRFFFSFLHFAHENTLSQQVPKFVMCEKKKKKNQNTSTVQSHLPSTLCHYHCRPFQERQNWTHIPAFLGSESISHGWPGELPQRLQHWRQQLQSLISPFALWRNSHQCSINYLVKEEKWQWRQMSVIISFIKQLSVPVASNSHEVRLSSGMNWPISQWNQRLLNNVEIKYKRSAKMSTDFKYSRTQEFRISCLSTKTIWH